MRYEHGNATLLNDFLKQHQRVPDVKARLVHLAANLKEQDSEIQTLSAQLELTKPGPKPF